MDEGNNLGHVIQHALNYAKKIYNIMWYRLQNVQIFFGYIADS